MPKYKKKHSFMFVSVVHSADPNELSISPLLDINLTIKSDTVVTYYLKLSTKSLNEKNIY